MHLQEVSDRSCTLELLAKDYFALSLSTAQVLTDGRYTQTHCACSATACTAVLCRALLIAAADLRRNIQFFQYEPAADDDLTIALGLVRKADFNAAGLITKMV